MIRKVDKREISSVMTTMWLKSHWTHLAPRRRTINILFQAKIRKRFVHSSWPPRGPIYSKYLDPLRTNVEPVKRLIWCYASLTEWTSVRGLAKLPWSLLRSWSMWTRRTRMKMRTCLMQDLLLKKKLTVKMRTWSMTGSHLKLSMQPNDSKAVILLKRCSIF